MKLKPVTFWTVIAFSFLVLFIFEMGNLSGDGDFTFFYLAGHRFLNLINPYSISGYPKGYPGFSYPPPAFYLITIPSLFRFPLFSLALRMWDFICLLSLSLCVFLWIRLLWLKHESDNFSFFTLIFAASITAPVVWAFEAHQLIIPLLLLISVAVYASYLGNDSKAGFFSALALFKPHLVILAIITLFFRSSHKKNFCAGALAGLVLMYVPYLLLFHKSFSIPQITRGALACNNNYYFDDQNLIVRMFPAVAYRDGIEVPGISIENHAVKRQRAVKYGCFAVITAIWILLMLKIKKSSLLWLTASGLALNLIFAPYSHFYDAAMMLPVMLLGISSTSRRLPVGVVCCAVLLINLGLYYVLCYSPKGYYNWARMGWASLIYFVLGSFLYLWPWREIEKRRPKNYLYGQ
jgi:hypothetical protein